MTFAVQVTSTAGTATGSVILTDVSNGTILATPALTNGTATFTTAALAPGTRRVVARYSGDTSFRPSSSARLEIPVAQAGSDALAYQVDPRHDGNQSVGRLQARSLTKRWSITLGAVTPSGTTTNVSYPLVARGRVFVTVPNAQSSGSTLYALNADTGAIDWSAGLGSAFPSFTPAYDGRRVFALTHDGILTAFVAGTGHELWAKGMPGQSSFTAPLAAYDGMIYVSGSGLGGTVYAVSEADGAIRWTAPVANGDQSSPAVDSSGVYVSYSCQQDYRFSLSGSQIWHHMTSCGGGGGSTAALHGNSVYARGSGSATDSPLILSKSSGISTGSFASTTVPAFGNSNMYTLQNGNLVAVDPSGSPNRWTFQNGNLVTAPVVNGGVVYVGSVDGTVYGVSAKSGAKLWTGTAGSTIIGGSLGMAIGGGLLVVPAGPALTAFGN